MTTVNAKLSTARVNDAEAKLDAGERDDQRQTASLNQNHYDAVRNSDSMIGNRALGKKIMNPLARTT